MLRAKSVFISSFKAICSCFSNLTVKDILLSKPTERKVVVQGWVRAIRKHKDLYFVDLVDGTCHDRLQIVIPDKCIKSENSCPAYGSSIRAEGSLIPSTHKGQEVELIADSWNTLGSCAGDYPFHYHQIYSAEYIRQLLHLRPRTRRFSSVLRIRNHASIAVHKFFQDEGFCFIHTPIITQNDCEGAGETFSVELRAKKSHLDKQNNVAVKNGTIQQDEGKPDLNNPAEKKPEEFFNVPTYLTVSGQLHLEAMACALTKVYNFGPVFRAESSRTRQHASEFQMIEAESAFVDSIDKLMQIAEKCIKQITQAIMDNCINEVKFISQDIKDHEEYIRKITTESFVQMSYNDAINILESSKESLSIPIKWGDDLSAEHKQFLVKHCHNVPVFVCMFPSALKPFYMKSDENEMAYCFDLFAAYGGEICGGSLREDSEEILQKKYPFYENGSLLWYLDLRKYGTVPHGGFGIGFDRLLQSILGISNIRDVTPFPRRKYDCKC